MCYVGAVMRFDPSYWALILGGSSGFGLATAKKVIERHHGTIEAHCKKGEGAAIMVTFPMFKG